MKLTEMLAGRSPRATRWAKLLAQFFSGQVLLQLLTAVTGFLLVNWLGTEEFAKYAFVSSVQLTFGALVELGIGSSVVALSGKDKYATDSLARYLGAAHFLRSVIFAAMSPLILYWIYSVARLHDWAVDDTGVLGAAVLLAIYLQGTLGYIRIPFTVRRQLHLLYGFLVMSAGLRLAIIALAYPFGMLTATWALLTLAMFQLVELIFIRVKITDVVTAVAVSSTREATRSILSYLLPQAPAHVYWAFQSQIVIFIVAIMGTSSTIADVGALGRLAQVFALLGAFNVVFVAPYFAALDRDRLVKWFLGVVALSMAAVAPLAMLGFVFPKQVLLLLGSKYAHLDHVVGWMILAGCISHVYGTVWTICAARRYVAWWTTATFISISLVSQVAAIMVLNLSTVEGAVAFGLVTTLANLLAYTIISVISIRRERRIPITPMPPSMAVEVAATEMPGN